MVKNGKGKGPKEQVLVEEDNRLALIEDQKRQHLYVVPIEHIVCDPPTVKERDEVQFSYGKKFFQGSILKIGKCCVFLFYFINLILLYRLGTTIQCLLSTCSGTIT